MTASSQGDSNILADCFESLLSDDGDPTERRVALVRVSEFVNRVCSALKG